MKQRMDNESMLQWMEQKQNLLLRIRAAITLYHMDIVKELSYQLQMLIIKERENYETKST